MHNFNYCTPTRLLFGKGVIKKLPGILEPLGKTILLTYGGGSIKKSGLYDTVRGLLEGFTIVELSGIEPNPKYSTSVLEGVRLCKEQGVEAILAVGGGSVLDCSKAIAAGAEYDGEPWDLISGKVRAKAALPLVDVLTLAATGSEWDAGCVISRTETNDKVGYMDRHLFPVCSILDPTYTFTVSARQTAAGTADAMSHVMEQYFAEDTTLLNDGMCEAALKSLMANVRIALAEPENYTARAELMQACSYACNGIFSQGNSGSGWPLHGMEHALSAYYDITHGEGLAILIPHWMKHVLNEKTVHRFVKYGVNVFGIDPSLPPHSIAERAIEETSRFFASIGIPMRLRDVGINGSRLAEMARHVAEEEGLGFAWAPLAEEDILAIFQAAS